MKTINASEIPNDAPEFIFASQELTEFHYMCGGTSERPGWCDSAHHGTNYIVNHGKGYRTYNVLNTYSCVPWSLNIVEGA